MTRNAPAALWSAVCLAACATGPEGDPSTQPAGASSPPPARRVTPGAVRTTLAPGSVVRLLPWTASPAPTEPCVDGLWRESMRQSRMLDVAAGPEDTAAPLAITVHVDTAAGRLSSTLTQDGSPPLPLATAASSQASTSAVDALVDAIDELALRTRQALGERVAVAPPPCRDIYSARAACVEATEIALLHASAGNHHLALAPLRRARSRDPGCTITLAALARTLLALGLREGDPGNLDEARRVANEALLLRSRGSATTRHRLAHVLLVADGQRSRDPQATDRDLLALGEVTLRERPHDPHALFSKAVALNFLGRYPESLAPLRRLAVRWPESAEAAYHLTFSELAAGNAATALATIRRAAPRLPRRVTVVPMALAMFHAGQHDALRTYLDGLAADPVYRKSAELHEIRRMQAAHALLTDRAADATRLMLEDLEWIRQRPSGLERRALDVAELGEVLVQIGRAADLRLPLQAFEEVGELPPTFAQVMVLLGGLIQVDQAGERAEVAEAHLRKSGQAVWSSVLRAAAYRRRGELMDELKERVFQYQTTEQPLWRASLARVLDAAGSPDEARQVRVEVRRQLLALDLRRPRQHPLMGPAAALAYLATVR